MVEVLVSGAGIAGSTLAYWLSRHGFEVTVVERAAGSRSSGNPVDVRGPALEVVTAMGVLPELRAAATDVDRLRFVDARGRRRASMRVGDRDRGEVELARADLATILAAASGDRVRMRWGDGISEIEQSAAGVTVGFESGERAHYDYVLGADGLHSAVRRLTFGDDREFVRHMGIYIATVPVTRSASEIEVVMYNSPGRSISVHPAGGRPIAAFMFRRAPVAGLDHRDSEAQRRLLVAEFAGRMGPFEDVLDEVRAGGDLYFDAVSKVSLPRWSRGRVTLVGDAASCLSLFGDGSSLAIAGAHTLAEELATAPQDPAAAWGRYEQRHRDRIGAAHRGVRFASALMVPGSRPAIGLRNTAVRLFAAA
ncbi:FAD-dependent oxidoreductase [Nocardia sp. NRRL WC-3656]|uniref:FAD-dependent oxidoreductase n=1 Tax=Nocardia sp. NRRL WC-3656 TaxID=1463824 RepID=UPI0004C304D3|nr:FAD-dependent oxidoreductase [Nocardia sp. NRRL WC-3656]